MQIAQLVAAFLILVPFAGVQLRRLNVETVQYQLLNLLGSGTLAVVALDGRQWGFLVLEGVWAVMSAVGLLRVTRQRGPSTGAR
jgi:hypothetical protein